MIKNKEDYLFFLVRDRISLKETRRNVLVQFLRDLLFPNYIYIFQRKLRKLEYYKNTQTNIFRKLYYLYLYSNYRTYQLKLGFSIPPNVFGFGLAIAHYGTIVVNGNAKIGNNCRIHTSTNIGANGGDAPKLGNNIYIGPGAKIFGDITIADNIKIGANSVVNKSFSEKGLVIAGIPAKQIKK
jgi:serine O-acetyltransferase